MHKEQLFEIMNNNPSFFLATVDGQFPRVRGMLLYKADSSGIYFHTGSMKNVYQQILNNKNAELCFVDTSSFTQLRVRGTLEIIDNNDLKDEITNHPSREFVREWKSSSPHLKDFYDNFIVLRMNDGKALLWTMETNFSENKEIDLF